MNAKQIEKSLKVCRAVAGILKEQFPNDIMKLKKNTIIEHSKKNSRLLHGTKTMSGCQAYYSRENKRIVITQKFLIDQVGWDGHNHYSLNPIMEKRIRKHIYLKKNGFPEDKIIEKEHTIRKRYFDPETNRILYGPRIYGNWALIELMCHELAHHRTSGHGKGFKVKYLRLRQHMANAVISGKFYDEVKA